MKEWIYSTDTEFRWWGGVRYGMVRCRCGFTLKIVTNI